LSNLLYVKRRALRLAKQEVASKLGVHEQVVGQWERGDHRPRVKYVPALVSFLRDDSWLPQYTFEDRLYRFRALRGWSQAAFGHWMGVDERTIGRWESGELPPDGRAREIDVQMNIAIRVNVQSRQ
jgi:DNA-binding transcriptional regulator YiaG